MGSSTSVDGEIGYAARRGFGAKDKMINVIYGTRQLIAVNTPATSIQWHTAGVRTESPLHRLD